MSKPGVLNCMVVDDEPLALSLLSDYIRKIPQLNLYKATSDPMEALPLAISGEADLIFLDIQMPELNGLQFMKILGQRSLVIVTTAYSEYALEGYEHHVVDYLVKPITFDRFIIAVEKATGRFPLIQPITGHPAQHASVPNNIFVKTEYRMLKVEFDDILFLEGARDYVVIHTREGQVLTLESLKNLEERLPGNRFMRIHKSYIVALDKINFVERSRVSIGEQLLPVSDTFKGRLDGYIYR
ncbi:LytR/AlgR family response regulator transcription factor [Hufsiella ginkgonis]|uniref:Response regulator n=1 Tax=Hufsiella ginkgonis TaxID=2695274 RepID=A0A7K1XYZ9_9SPHI|nr:LytTR family DNA-binding domain-containing protein [Hufsiella ginkgonis]MXV15969.1 response regulator [Hufsiella ginkgonis]